MHSQYVRVDRRRPPPPPPPFCLDHLIYLSLSLSSRLCAGQRESISPRTPSSRNRRPFSSVSISVAVATVADIERLLRTHLGQLQHLYWAEREENGRSLCVEEAVRSIGSCHGNHSQFSLLSYSTHTTLYYPTQLVCIQSHKYTHLGRNVSRAALCWMNEFTQCAAAAEAEEARELYASAG